MTRPVDLAYRRALAAAPRLPVLDAEDYVRLNGDLAREAPFPHFARYGVWERRELISSGRRTSRLAVATAHTPPPWRSDFASDEHTWRSAAELCVRLRVDEARTGSSAGLISALLGGVGAQVEIDSAIDPARPGDIEVLMDAASCFGGRPEGADADRLARAVVWVGEAPDAPEFKTVLPYALAARGVICREADAYVAFVHSGRPAVWLGSPPADPAGETSPPDHPLVAGLSRRVRNAPPGLPWAQRPIEIAALEDATPARSEAWSRMVEPLSERDLVIRRPAGPHAHLPREAEVRRWIYARSRVVLHLHAEQPRAVDAQSASEAADAGAVLLTETATPHLLLAPNIHYAEASARRMANRLDDLAADPDGSVGLASALRETLAKAFEPERLGLDLARLLTAGADDP